jgi:hypothetical protein
MHEFTPVISCTLIRSHAKIRQRILSFKFWINAMFATFSLFWSVPQNGGGKGLPRVPISKVPKSTLKPVWKVITTGHV